MVFQQKRSRRSSPSSSTHSKGIWVGRASFLTGLACVAVVLGVLAEVLLSRSEQNLAKEQFRSIASRAVVTAKSSVVRKLHGTNTMAKIAGNANPNAEDWPFAIVQGFEEIGDELRAASNGRGMVFAPIVMEDQLEEFENFALTYYNTTRLPEVLAPGAGVSTAGRGIWGKAENGTQYLDRDPVRDYATEFNYFAPILHQNINAGSVLLFNFRSEEVRGRTLDNAVRCSLNGGSICSQITDIITLVTHEGGNPAALLLSPVFPALNRSGFPSGFVGSSIVFIEVFENMFGKNVNGILCVLETPDEAIEFLVEKGQHVRQVEGIIDKLEDKYLDLQIEETLTPEEIFGKESPKYKLTLYPTHEFYDVYSTGNSIFASIGSVFIIALTGLLFMVYDFFVRREFSHKSELLEIKRRFMRFVCHEVRTPMNSVCLGLSLMQEEMESVLKAGTESANITSWRELSMEIHQSAQRAVDVLSDLLNYDKIEQGELSLEPSMFSTQDWVERTCSEFNVEAKRRGLNCVVDLCQASDCVLVGDKLRLTQVLRNLLSNALKFTPEGGKLTISLREEIFETEKGPIEKKKLQDGTIERVREAGNTIVSVADSGAGMTATQLSNLFQEGVQFNVNELQAGKGSGIGLFIAKGIVEQHGGTLTCDSEGLGKGSTFTMRLPLFVVLAKEPKSKDEENCPPTVLGSDTSASTNKRLGQADQSELNFLVVDDSKTNQKLLIRLLERDGHTCTGASDGDEAVHIVKTTDQSFDVILLDYEMPKMNGPTAASFIRELGFDSLIIGITGNVLADDVQHFKNKGANEVLPKPVKVADINAVVERFGITNQKTLSSP